MPIVYVFFKFLEQLNQPFSKSSFCFSSFSGSSPDFGSSSSFGSLSFSGFPSIFWQGLILCLSSSFLSSFLFSLPFSFPAYFSLNLIASRKQEGDGKSKTWWLGPCSGQRSQYLLFLFVYELSSNIFHPGDSFSKQGFPEPAPLTCTFRSLTSLLFLPPAISKALLNHFTAQGITQDPSRTEQSESRVGWGGEEVNFKQTFCWIYSQVF